MLSAFVVSSEGQLLLCGSGRAEVAGRREIESRCLPIRVRVRVEGENGGHKASIRSFTIAIVHSCTSPRLHAACRRIGGGGRREKPWRRPQPNRRPSFAPQSSPTRQQCLASNNTVSPPPAAVGKTTKHTTANRKKKFCSRSTCRASPVWRITIPGLANHEQASALLVSLPVAVAPSSNRTECSLVFPVSKESAGANSRPPHKRPWRNERRTSRGRTNERAGMKGSREKERKYAEAKQTHTHWESAHLVHSSARQHVAIAHRA